MMTCFSEAQPARSHSWQLDKCERQNPYVWLHWLQTVSCDMSTRSVSSQRAAHTCMQNTGERTADMKCQHGISYKAAMDHLQKRVSTFPERLWLHEDHSSVPNNHQWIVQAIVKAADSSLPGRCSRRSRPLGWAMPTMLSYICCIGRHL